MITPQQIPGRFELVHVRLLSTDRKEETRPDARLWPPLGIAGARFEFPSLITWPGLWKRPCSGLMLGLMSSCFRQNSWCTQQKKNRSSDACGETKTLLRTWCLLCFMNEFIISAHVLLNRFDLQMLSVTNSSSCIMTPYRPSGPELLKNVKALLLFGWIS